MAVLSLPDLVRAVRQRAGEDPLDRVEAALRIGEELASGADDLIGQFVTEARDAGCSWTQIGARIGVSKQAARQRFTAPPAPARLAGLEQQPRLVACLAAAVREAAADGAAEIGTHHQLLGLYEEGVAATILEKLGIRADEVRRAARAMFPGGGEPGEHPPPESAEARQAVEGAEALARRAGLDYIGPAHLLGALALDQGSRARRVLGHLGASIPAIKKELECYISPGKPRRRRGRGKTADQRCSFCGKIAASGVGLVAGPGVWICAECVDLAGEILAERASAQAGPTPPG
jgi:ClpX C4-type zinc finger/Clp amino terminal domain, pathogenicity island component